MKYLVSIFAGLFLFVALRAQQTVTEDMVRQITPHPRLLLRQGEELYIKNAIARDKTFAEMNNALLLAAESCLTKEPISNKGSQSYREALRRLFLWSYAYRMTLDSGYAERAEREMLHIADFDSWSGEYIMIAELIVGMSVGYDWTYDVLPVTSREKIADAIIKKGIEPSFGKAGYHFLHAVSNWNLVGNTGVSVGAIATAETDRSLCLRTLQRMLQSIYMKQYAPEGVYPEGYGYWGYGTNNVVLLIDALHSAFGTDFGLSDSAGFMDTAEFLLHMTGDSQCFNFSDTKSALVINPAVFWFATRNKDSSLLWNEKKTISRIGYKECVKYRMAPLVMLWGNSIDMQCVKRPASTFFVDTKGVTPVALMRSSWDDDAIYLGLKGGCPQVGHGHMDIGSFVMDADGERWIIDLGAPKYTDEYFHYVDADDESKRVLQKSGIEYLKVPAQDSPRWLVPQASARYHNLITVDGEQQYVKGYATFQKTICTDSLKLASIDLTNLYFGKLASYRRTGSIVGSTYVQLSDELQAADKTIVMRWNVMTDAVVGLVDNKHIVLKKNGKSMTMKVFSDKEVSIVVEPLLSDSGSNGKRQSSISFTQELHPYEKQSVEVLFIPESSCYARINNK